MAHDIFISYASADKPIADAICARLEGQGSRCWIAPRDILPGMDWSEAIVDAIGKSRIMVLVFSESSNQSQQVKREVERAVSKGVMIVPLRIHDVPLSKSLEYFISSPHWLDALSPPLEKHLAYLSDTVQMLLGRLKKGPTPIPKVEAAAPVEPPAPPTQPSPPEPRSVLAALLAEPPPAEPAGPSAAPVSIRHVEPHRGTLIMVLGIVSIVAVPILGVVALILATQDLKAMQEGRMDREGESQTRIGMICGIIGIIEAVLCCITLPFFYAAASA